MNDNKLKIRIQIQQQPPRAIEQLYPDLAEPEMTYEQTYDWGKIAAAVIALLGLVVLISYLIFGSSDEPGATAALPAENQLTPSQDNTVAPESTPPDTALGNNASIPGFNQSQPHRTDKQQDANMLKPDGEARNTPSVSVPSVKPQNGTLSNKPIIIPRKKPIASSQVVSHRSPDRPEIVRAQLSHAIKGREPVDIIESVKLHAGESKPIFFYVHLRDLQDQEVTIQWYRDDKLDSRLPLRIRTNNWRTNASKQLDHERAGAWRVEVVDHSGNVLAARHFTVTQY